MSQLRLNPLTGRWVTIVAERAERPTDFAPRGVRGRGRPRSTVPVLPGHEEATPPALETVDEGGSWRMRVVPNLYPAFDGDDPLRRPPPRPGARDGRGQRHPRGVRVHARPRRRLDRLDDARRRPRSCASLQRRLAEHAARPSIRYTQVIVNHGREAGASLAHPHAQILGLPFVPGEILDEERAFARFAGGCVICTTIEAELADGERVVFADDDVVCVAPFWSGAPYELLLIPRRHEPHLQDADAASLAAMGRAIRDAVAHLESALGDVAYNLGFHTAPHEHSGQFHWHVHLWPKLVTQAGFERGTGVMINVMPPELAAETLRAVARPPDERRAAWPRSRSAPTSTPRPSDVWRGRSNRSSATSTGWPTPRRSASTPTSARRRHPVRRATPRSGRSALDRPHGDHRVGARAGDGRAPRRARHRRPAASRSSRSTPAGAPASRGRRSSRSRGGWAGRSAAALGGRP